MTAPRFINPEQLGAPKGYNNGVVMTPPGGGSVLFVSGQIGGDKDRAIVGDLFADQFDQALANVVAVVEAAGGTPESIGKLTIFVTSVDEYIAAREEIGRRYRARMGRHFPAMTLVEVRRLVEPRAKVEIEGLAYV
jgi:enamine deaminase RidA (YjgF/YER057c/UK114 family)